MGSDQSEFGFSPIPFRLDSVETFIEASEFSAGEISGDITQIKPQIFGFNLDVSLTSHIGAVGERTYDGKFIRHRAIDGEKCALVINGAAQAQIIIAAKSFLVAKGKGIAIGDCFLPGNHNIGIADAGAIPCGEGLTGQQ